MVIYEFYREYNKLAVSFTITRLWKLAWMETYKYDETMRAIQLGPLRLCWWDKESLKLKFKQIMKELEDETRGLRR